MNAGPFKIDDSGHSVIRAADLKPAVIPDAIKALLDPKE